MMVIIILVRHAVANNKISCWYITCLGQGKGMLIHIKLLGGISSWIMILLFIRKKSNYGT